VRLLNARDVRRAGHVKIYDEGFTETAYRYIFPYKEEYKHKAAELQNLITILPSGKQENDEPLEQNEEAGLITYTRCQTMKEHDLAKVCRTHSEPFVWARPDKTFAVVQTWPVEINAKFHEKFEEANSPEDAEKFEKEALDEFKTSMRKLFKLKVSEDLTVWSMKKRTRNEYPLYTGTGEALMAMLRINKKVRDALDIEALVGRDGIDCKWTCETRTGNQVWTMDLNLEYCLYVKDGWDKMACVKPKAQFDWDSFTHGQAKMDSDAGSAPGTLPYVMDLEWFASEAYQWTLMSALLVWSSAFLTVMLRWFGTDLGWTWVNTPWVLAVATGMTSMIALYADLKAMKWCIVPWLQKVKQLKFICTLPFPFFLVYQLFSTVLQIFTIQSNAWFMVTAVQNNDEMLELWTFLWKYSMFGFLPKRTWSNVFTPKVLGIFIWCLSTLQLILPLMKSVPWPGSQKSSRKNGLRFPTRRAGDARAAESEESEDVIFVKHGGVGQDEETPFVPESFYYDFDTCWSKLVGNVFEVWGFPAYKCTYRESVAHLALASGLRYTGAMSLSYPKQRIYEIIQLKEGYSIKTPKGLEPLPQGWQLRALKEFQKLAWWQESRAFFIMVCKLAFQMNLQISYIIIFRILHDDITKMTDTMTVTGCISIMSLLFTFTLELLDVFAMIVICWHVRSSVREAVFKLGSSSKPFALEDFQDDDGQQDEDEDERPNDERTNRKLYSGRDVKAEYYIAMRSFWRLIGLTIFSTWLIFYALLKFFCAMRCESLGLAEPLPAS